MKTFAELGTIAKILWRWICGLIKVAWTLAALAIVGLIIALVGSIFINTELDHRISKRYEVYKRGEINRYYIIDHVTGKKTAKRISSIDKNFGEDSLIRFSRKDIWGNNERFGYINARTGKIVIEPQFYYAGEFSEGLAAVSSENGAGFIDATGKIAIPIKGHIVGGKNAKIINGCAIVKTYNKKYGIISVSGKWALEAIYDEIEHVNNGVYIVKNENCKYGAWSAARGWIFEPIYGNIVPNMSDTSLEVTNNGICWAADFDGKTTKPLIYLSSHQLFYYPVGCMGNAESEGVATEYLVFYIDERCGVLNIHTKEVVLPAIYDDIEMLSKDVFELTIGLQTFLGYKDGTVVPIKTK